MAKFTLNKKETPYIIGSLAISAGLIAFIIFFLFFLTENINSLVSSRSLNNSLKNVRFNLESAESILKNRGF